MKYALVVTGDEALLPGVNAILNGLKYYGSDEIDFYYLYWKSPRLTAWLDSVETSGLFPYFKPINIETMIDGSPQYRPVYYLKFYRSLFASRMHEYDFVGYIDADRFLLSDITDIYDLAAQTRQIVMIDYRYNPEWRQNGFYDQYPLQATNGCPFDPSVTVFDPRIWGKHFAKVADLGAKVTKKSEMPTVNYMLIKDDLLNNIQRLPDRLWNLRKHHLHDMTWDEATGTLLLDTGERVRSLHGRWWWRGVRAKKSAKADFIKTHPGR